MQNNIKDLQPGRVFISLLILGSFLVWVYCLKGFFVGQIPLMQDAPSYFDAVKLYLDNISKGIYPLWNPEMGTGVPSTLLLRRIGEFNPFYLLILVFQMIGLSYKQSYLIFLCVYFFVGLMGFYCIARLVFQDRLWAFFAYLLLLYSTLGTKLFDSYILLIFVPMVWFFYFLMAFAQSPKKADFLGGIFTLIILLTTYVPFYFLTIFCAFLVCFILFYTDGVKKFMVDFCRFAGKHKYLVAASFAVLLLSSLPGILFMLESAKGDFVLPQRHMDSEYQSVITVSSRHIAVGGVNLPILIEQF